MEESKENPSQVNRFQVNRMQNINIVEWNKKRKLQNEQLDLLRPKHKCWVGSFSSEHASMFDENTVLDSVHKHNHVAKSNKTDAAFLDDRSEPESAEDSNSFIEDSDTATATSVNQEAILEEDCGNACQNVNRVSYSEEETIVDSKYNPSYSDLDIQALENHEEHLVGFGSISGHAYSDYVEIRGEDSEEKEFEYFLLSSGVNPNLYDLSSERWNVNQDAESRTRPPTVDQEFEQYFSMLML